jgi:hypothetical protein
MRWFQVFLEEKGREQRLVRPWLAEVPLIAGIAPLEVWMQVLPPPLFPLSFQVVHYYFYSICSRLRQVPPRNHPDPAQDDPRLLLPGLREHLPAVRPRPRARQGPMHLLRARQGRQAVLSRPGLRVRAQEEHPRFPYWAYQPTGAQDQTWSGECPAQLGGPGGCVQGIAQLRAGNAGAERI